MTNLSNHILKVEMIEDYLNLDHGLELYPGINKSHRGNENGILYFAEYLILKEMLGKGISDFDRQTFETIAFIHRTQFRQI